MKASPREESRYARSLIEASLDPLVTISAEGKITDVNEASIKVTGIPREMLIGTDFSNYFTEPQKARQGYLQVFDKGFVANYPLTLKHQNGNLTDVLYNASVYKDNKGNVLGVFAAARDVTEQKWAIDLRKANKELAFQNEGIEKRAAELFIANEELAFQNTEKEKRAAELIKANEELAFQNSEKEKRAAELIKANEELLFQNEEKVKRAAELLLSGQELIFQTREKEKQKIANIELKALSDSIRLTSQYSRSLIEASLDPLVTINIEGKITDMNEATVNITGIIREKLTGTDFLNYFTEPDKAREVYQKVFATGSVVDSPLTLRHLDGKLTDVLFNGSVYKDDIGHVMGVVIVARDVTNQKRIAAELTEAKVFAELATKNAEDAKIKAEKASRIAEDAVKAKQQFLSNMSHEIRTPMNAIIGFTKVLLKTDFSAKQKEYLTAIKLSGDALIVLINDILDLAKVDAGKMTFEKLPFKMSLSLSAMLHLFETKIKEKNLVLVKEYDQNIPEVLIGDPVRLRQIILNLLSNAVRFTNKGKIIVKVQLLREEEDSVSIAFSVSDTGIGIPEKKIEMIFDNFQQASSGTSRLYGGTGLGLAIVKQLVETQGGSISINSKMGEGSSFGFILSFSKTKTDIETTVDPVEFDSEIDDMKVLVVEDIPLNQLLMKTLLDDFGFGCDIAENGKVAIEKMSQLESSDLTQSYDVILMDLQMPEMNGFEATEYIRNTMKSDIPIIALTADVTTVDLNKCKAVGMNDYISKPIDERLLYSKLISLVKKTSIEIVAEDDLVAEPLRKCTNLDYLIARTKSNRGLMTEMISLYLQQTPPLIASMKQGLLEMDWDSMSRAVHKIIPSFAIMGIDAEFEIMARKVQEIAGNQIPSELAITGKMGLPEMVSQLETVCLQACFELEEELNELKQ